MDTIHECRIVSHFGWHGTEEMANLLLLFHIYVEIANQDDAIRLGAREPSRKLLPTLQRFLCAGGDPFAGGHATMSHALPKRV
jgi:hypothetical protein